MTARRIARGAVAGAFGLAAAAGLLVGCGGDSASEPDVALSPAGERGREIVEANGCTSCHSTDGSRGTGPTWKDLAGSEVELRGGETVVADDAYLERAILAPREEIVDGYGPIMPTYENQLDEAELADVIAYLRDLSAATTAAPAD